MLNIIKDANSIDNRSDVKNLYDNYNDLFGIICEIHVSVFGCRKHCTTSRARYDEISCEKFTETDENVEVEDEKSVDDASV